MRADCAPWTRCIKIDIDGDGTVSHDEFIAYQSKLFEMMDTNHTGSLGPQEFLGN
jgi:hypothetical protein